MTKYRRICTSLRAQRPTPALQKELRLLVVINVSRVNDGMDVIITITRQQKVNYLSFSVICLFIITMITWLMTTFIAINPLLTSYTGIINFYTSGNHKYMHYKLYHDNYQEVFAGIYIFRILVEQMSNI